MLGDLRTFGCQKNHYQLARGIGRMYMVDDLGMFRVWELSVKDDCKCENGIDSVEQMM